MDTIQLGFMLMLYGLGGVFLSLILFYLSIKAMTAIAVKQEKRKNAK